MQGRCLVCVECVISGNSLWADPMELRSDLGQMETRFGVFGDSVNPSARSVLGLG
jgi:hypothetical protein